MTPHQLAVMLFLLTFAFGLCFTLLGGLLLSARSQRELGALCGALGILVGYPFLLFVVMWFRPTVTVGAFLGLIGLLLYRSRRRHESVAARFLLACRQALLLAALGVLFWLPGTIGDNAGLFTEAGGDFTIYAGLPAKVGNVPLWGGHDFENLVKYRGLNRAPGVPWAFDGPFSQSIYPPAAGWSIQRIIEVGWAKIYSGWFGLQHALAGFCGAKSMSECYLAVLSLLWALLISVPYQLLLLRGRKTPAWFALALLAGAHGLAAVAYNHYYPQFLSSALVVCLLGLIYVPTAVGLPSLALLTLTALTAIEVGIAYYPLLPVLLVPLVALVLFRGPAILRDAKAEALRLSGAAKVVWSAIAMVALACSATLYAAEMSPLLTLADKFLLGGTAETHSRNLIDLGSPRQYDLDQLASLFGAFSLHRLPPYWSSEPAESPARWFVVLGGVMTLAAMVAWLLIGCSSRTDREDERRLTGSLAWSLAVVLPLEVYLGRRYEYTQYKALSYLLPFVLLFLVLPLSRSCETSVGRLVRWTGTVGRWLLLLGLVMFRWEGCAAIANVKERSAILDVGLPVALESVKQRDDKAFVLAFPPSPWMFSMWEYGLRDIRALEMQFYNYSSTKEKFLAPSDTSHLWVLRATNPSPSPAEAVHERSLWVYRPLSDGRCRVEPAPLHAASRQVVVYALLGRSNEALWLQKDIEFWVFNPLQSSQLNLALKEHTCLVDDREVTVWIRYPFEDAMTIAISRLSGRDALVSIPTARFIKDGRSPSVVVLRVLGTGYSDLTCGTN